MIQAIAVLVPAFGPSAIALMLIERRGRRLHAGYRRDRARHACMSCCRHAPAQQKSAWSKATTSFAVLQAVAAYGMSYLFAQSANAGGRGGDYAILFEIATPPWSLALLIDLIAGRWKLRR